MKKIKKVRDVPLVRFLGASSDFRTNRWSVSCICGKQFEPSTTRLSTQTINCPRCGVEMFANYNAEPAEIKLVQP